MSLLSKFNVINEIDLKQNIYVQTGMSLEFSSKTVPLSNDLSIEKQIHIFAKLDKECTNYIAELLCNSELLN